MYSRDNPIKYSDPSGHDFIGAINDFAVGFISEGLRTTFGFIPQVQESLKVQPSESDAMMIGRVGGDIAGIVAGVAGFAGGLATTTGGTILSCVGTACVGAVVTVGAGTAAMAAGAVIALNGAANLGGNLAMMKGDKKGGSGAGNYKFPDAKEMAKRLGVDKDAFEEIKHDDILGDKTISNFSQKIGSTNPDIGVDSSGNIVLKNPSTGKVINTYIPLSKFKPQE
jgi:hypothetical protein